MSSARPPFLPGEQLTAVVDQDDWNRYKFMVLDKLEHLTRSLNDLNMKIDQFRSEDMAQVKVDIAMLKVKSGLWGALAGAIVAVGTVLIRLLITH